MENRVVVDTDLLIDYFAGVSPGTEAIAQLLREDRLAVTTLSLFELACGAQTPDQIRDLELLLQAVSLIPLDAAAALRAGAVYRQLKAKGQLIEIPDLLIAGCCLAAEMPLLTRNRAHFQRIEGLALPTASDILKEN